MMNINNTVIAMATGLLALGLASSSASAQVAKSAAGFTPGQPFVVTISGERGTPLMVVLGGRIPLQSDRRVVAFLPDLDDGEQELNYTLSIQGDASLSGSANKKPQEVVGRIHKVFVKSPAGATLGQQGGMLISISAAGLQHSLGYDLSGDIVWSDPCVYNGDAGLSEGSPSTTGGGSMIQSDGNLSGGGATSINVSTSAGLGGKSS